MGIPNTKLDIRLYQLYIDNYIIIIFAFNLF